VRHAVKDVVEGNFSALWIAVLTGFDQPFGLMQGRGIHEHNLLLFGSRIEEVTLRRFVRVPSILFPLKGLL